LGAVVELRRDGSHDVILEILDHLWETKRQSIALLETWLAKTPDHEIKVGLATHLTDERRHFRLLGEEIKRRGGRPVAPLHDLLGRPFGVAQAQSKDIYRVGVLYRGIKAFTVLRCCRLLPLVDAGLARTLDQITREEEGHIRWAEIRLGRIRDMGERRQCAAVVDEVEGALELIWARPWRQLSAAGLRKAS